MQSENSAVGRETHVREGLPSSRRLVQARLGRRGAIRRDVRELPERPGRVLGRARQAYPMVQALYQGQGRFLRPAQRVDQMVRGRRHQRRLQLHRSSSTHASPPDCDHLGRRQSGPLQAHHLRRAGEPCRPLRQCAEVARGEKGRPRHDLSADDPGGRLRDARLRADRRDPLDRVRGFLARCARRSHRGRGFRGRHHRRRGSARRAEGAAEGQRRHRCARRPAA